MDLNMKFISRFNHGFTNRDCLHSLDLKLSCPKAIPVDLNMKFISRFNHGFTNRDCLHCTIQKALYGFKEKRAHKVREMQFFLQNIQNLIFKIFVMHQSSLLN